MECSSCGHENRLEAKFCEECGSPATTACNGCDAELRPTAKFCDQCGMPVESSSVAPDLSVDVAAVRKTVTVLFCDVVGSTAFAERVDAETARDTMARYHAMAQATIEANGGSVAKYIGDGVMAIWGTPEVSPDDAERAVAAGVELQTGFGPIGASTADRYGIDLGLRVGINTGEVVIASDDADIIGDALNTAARLEAACSPGEVVVGESTWRLTRTGIDYQPLAPMALKGKAEPVATFLVARGGSQEPESNGAPPFVGRSAELASLRVDFDASTTDRSVRLTTVIGAPGVGKTRLAAELVASLRSSGTEITAFDLRCE
ncbi:MAG: adenylate/guanylate cyclase domain-containing protein, partial [Acidimicrobiales bacterium]